MSFFRHPHRPRRRLAASSPALILLLTVSAASGCTSTDEAATTAVPAPGPEAARYCRQLHHTLPRRVDGLDRMTPKPRSLLTAGWGDPAIILRCGVARPPAMSDPDADDVEVNGVGWLSEKQDDGSYRFTTSLRKAYVEVTLPKQHTGKGVNPLIDLASPVKGTIPEGIAE